jgi:hypothetical protein
MPFHPHSIFKIVTEDKEEIYFADSDAESLKKAKIPDRYKGKEWKDFQDFVKSEAMNVRKQDSEEPPHIKLMQKFEIADFDEAVT